MTSLSPSRQPGRRSLAVYQTPSPPEGWHGRDLVRIVDPVGLSMAWLSAGHAGAVVLLVARQSTDDPWTTLLHAAPGAPAATFSQRTGPGDAYLPLWETRIGWTMTRRDPISAAFGFAGGDITIDGMCETGTLRLQVTAEGAVLDDIRFDVERDEPGTASIFHIEERHDQGVFDVLIEARFGGDIQ